MSEYDTATNIGMTPLLQTQIPTQGAQGANTGPPRVVLLTSDFRQVDAAAVVRAGGGGGGTVDFANPVIVPANSAVPAGSWLLVQGATSIRYTVAGTQYWVTGSFVISDGVQAFNDTSNPLRLVAIP